MCIPAHMLLSTQLSGNAAGGKMNTMQVMLTWQGEAEAARAVLRVLRISSTHQNLTTSITMVYGGEISMSVFKLDSESLNNLVKVTHLVPRKDLKEASLTSEHAIRTLPTCMRS